MSASVVAGILAYREHETTIAGAVASVAALDDVLVFSGVPFGAPARISTELQEAAARSVGLGWAEGELADWYLGLDADERLVNGELLPALLEGYGDVAWPLPYVQESGQVTLAPFKLVRVAGARLLVGCDVYWWPQRGTLLLSGQAFPPELASVLPTIPHVLHVPSSRPDVLRYRRLSDRIEGTADRQHARPWVPPFVVPPARAA